MILSIKDKNQILDSIGSPYRNSEEAPFKTEDNLKKSSELDSILYAPSPVTGWPCNDLEIMEDAKTSPEIRSALQQRNQVLQPGISSTDDDAVLDAMPLNGESEEAFFNRVKPYVDDLEKPKDE